MTHPPTSRSRTVRLRLEALESRRLLAVDPLLITEFMANNTHTLASGDGGYSDWIEVHNPTAEAVDLSSWFLTDDSAVLDKWTFPSLPQAVLDPGEYLVVFASGQSDTDYVDAGGNLHTNFKLASGGEFLALSDPSQTVAHEFAPQYPQQLADVSYGVFPDDLPAGEVFFEFPTPAALNSSAVVVAPVIYSHSNPTFSSTFSLHLAGTTGPDQTIVYTLDASLPGENSPVYTDANPITIASTTQVRARIREFGKADGPVSTASFSRLGADVLAFQSQLPILLMENFGDGPVPGKGWNQTGANIQQVARQPAAVTLFDNDGGSASLTGPIELHSRAGVRERGAYSTTFPQPQYSLETWNELDQDKSVSVFDMADESDWILYAPNPNIDQTLMNNQFMFGLAYPTTVWAPQVQFVEAFLNTDGGDVTMSDYVGLYVWTEKVKRDAGRLDFDRFAEDGTSGGWLLSINRMDPSPVDDPGATPQHMHTPGPNGVLETLPNSSGRGDDIPRQYNAFLNFEHPNGYDLNATQRQAIENWFAEMENVLFDRTSVAWNDPVDGYAKYIDVENFIDYYILHNLSKNSDGLLLSMWVYNPDPNNGGKLKFGPPWDHDLGSLEGNPESNLMHRSDRLWYARLFQDPLFVEQYQNRWILWRQGILSDASMNQVFDDFVDEIGNDAAIRDGVSNLTSRIDTVKGWLASRAAALDQELNPDGITLIDFTVDQTHGAPPLTVQFTDQSAVPDAFAWQWDFGDGQTSDQQHPNHTYTTAGFYDVTLAVTGPSGTFSITAPSRIITLVAGDVNLDGTLDRSDVDAFIHAWRSDTTGLSDIEQYQLGDLNLSGTTNFADWFIINQAWKTQNSESLDLGALLAVPTADTVPTNTVPTNTGGLSLASYLAQAQPYGPRRPSWPSTAQQHANPTLVRDVALVELVQESDIDDHNLRDKFCPWP